MFGFFGESSRQQGAFNTNMPGLGQMHNQFGTYVYAHQGACPFCGLNLWAQHPAYNIYPHISGHCAKIDMVQTPGRPQEQSDADFLRQMGIKP